MDPAIWIPIALMGGGLLITMHQMVRRVRRETVKDLDKRIEEKAEMCLQDVLVELRGITAKLNNGVLQASEEHTKGIAAIRVDVAGLKAHVENLSKQVETALISEPRRKNT